MEKKMRHKKSGQVLDRKKAARKALIKSLAIALIKRGKIKTTAAKAKATKSFVERQITIGKKDNLNNFRKLLKELPPQEAKKIIKEISPRYKSRPGGYTRIIKIKQRKGDAAEIVQIELV